ncbi:hypothetical protein GCM10028801_35070 [Nocardioides maradonensis]
MTVAHRRSGALISLLSTAVLAGFGLVGASPSHAAAAAPTCAGRTATIVGTDGPDRLTGTPGRDVIVGGAGDDVISGMGGNDLICGGAGADRLFGGAGADRLLGEDGDDTLRGGLDQISFDGERSSFRTGDRLVGGAGDDVLDPGLDTRKTDFAGYDVVSYAGSPAGVRVDLTKATLSTPGTASGDGSDTIVWGPGMAVEGSAYADTLLGSAGRDVLLGHAGDDLIRGGAGRDELVADDMPQAAADADRVYGGPGNDDLTSYRGSDLLDAGAGDDRVSALAGIDEIYPAAPVTVRAGTGNDTVTLEFGAHTATVTGSSVRGGTGRDEVIAYLDRGTGWAVDNVAGTLAASIGDVRQTMDLDGFERFSLIGRPIAFRGSSKSEFLRVFPRVTAHMGAGDDRVEGGSGPDRIDGGAGNDTADGGPGADTCVRVEHRTSC